MEEVKRFGKMQKELNERKTTNRGNTFIIKHIYTTTYFGIPYKITFQLAECNPHDKLL